MSAARTPEAILTRPPMHRSRRRSSCSPADDPASGPSMRTGLLARAELRAQYSLSEAGVQTTTPPISAAAKSKLPNASGLGALSGVASPMRVYSRKCG